MVISIVKGSMESGLECYLIDKFLAVDSLVFMVSALLSFSSIRTVRMEANLERWAEILFLLGLVSMTLITLVFAFEIV
ncbi:hypothetical protein AADEFJLK_03307 [Methylovulum psychrotolerans]|uniref:Uncharacterized protein n=2 Tax=Methylovulum psychrotolerans TaxID=1704499 RepID=A0A2S5CJ63_9GAMM|nr:hypothetical protein AADEFJLK_03307 [Methylovulum psychrotolerans]